MTSSNTAENMGQCPICKEQEEFSEWLRQEIEKDGRVKCTRLTNTKPIKNCDHSR